jgi:tellurite resistance protein
VDTSDIVSIFLRGAIGGRGRKRARRAVNFLTGNRGFLTASTVLGAAGVAWGIYDSLKSGASGASGAVLYPSVSGATNAPTAVPPIPGTTAPTHRTEPDAPDAPIAPGAPGPGVLPNDLVRIVRLAVSAARADGTLSPQERELILEHAREAGVESAVEQELDAPRPLAEIVSGVDDAQRRQDLYVLAFTIVRADEAISGAERIYLAQLAHQLSLDAATVARLEQDTATTIDNTPE